MTRHRATKMPNPLATPTSAEGGDDMLVGINATEEERQAFAEKIQQHPRGYMAQPTVYLSQIPTTATNPPVQTPPASTLEPNIDPSPNPI